LNRHLLIVANGFRAAGFLIGLPSLLLCLYAGWIWIDVGVRAPDKVVTSPVDIQRQGLVGLLIAGANVIGKGFELFVRASRLVLILISIVAVALTLVGASLFLLGRGLFHHALWARIVAEICASGALMISFLTLTSFRRGAVFLALIPLGISIYVLWVLIRKFSPIP
jgi:hypothetical protein